MEKFIVTKTENEQYAFVFEAANDKIVLTSINTYITIEGALGAIDLVKSNATFDTQYSRKTYDEKWYYNLREGDGQIIGKSELYDSVTAMEKDIRFIKTNAPTAPIESSAKALIQE
jgi:uncharacterized protein